MICTAHNLLKPAPASRWATEQCPGCADAVACSLPALDCPDRLLAMLPVSAGDGYAA